MAGWGWSHMESHFFVWGAWWSWEDRNFLIANNFSLVYGNGFLQAQNGWPNLQQACQHQFSVPSLLFWHPMPPLIQFHIMFLYPAIQKASPVSSFFHSKHYPNWTLIWQVEFYEYSPITSSLSESFPCEYMTALQWLCCYMEKSNTAYIIKVSNLQTLK